MELINIFEHARVASRELNMLDKQTIDRVLRDVADAAEANCGAILAANEKDLALIEPTNPMYDRLLLTADRIAAIASDLRNVALLHSPVGEVLSSVVRPNGLQIDKVRVPFGVVGVIYEARPNVSFDVFALCFKSANASILKGGSDAHNSNSTIVGVIHNVLIKNKLNPNIVTLLPATREATAELLGAVGYVDVLIPRGSSSLINYVRDNARVPVIETGAGICHTYFDRMGNAEMGADIVFNAKTRRVSVCNALDSLIIHSSRLGDLPGICAQLSQKDVVVYADPRAYDALKGEYPPQLLMAANEHSYGTEFLGYKMSVKTVDSIEQAVEHVGRYSSKHSEAIISDDSKAIELFTRRVDAACVYANASTSFTDGGEFGFGAEIGISTQKLHARGPMALAELTSYKYIIIGNGQVRG